MSLRNVFKSSRQERQLRQIPLVPMVNRPVSTSVTVLLQVLPAIRHGLKELSNTDPQHALTEVALMSYLIGIGFDYRSARAIVESWECDEKLLGECLVLGE